MAPKRKQVASRRSTRNLGSTSRAVRRRAEEDSSSSPTAPTARRRIFVASWPVPSGRCLDFSFFDSEGFRIGQWLRDQGWEWMCSVQTEIYPELVREFFEHISFIGPSVASTVKGARITLDEQKVGELLKAPTEGVHILAIEDKISAFKAICERDDVDEQVPLIAQQLSADMRILHSVVCHILIPKVGRRDWIGMKEMATLYYIISGTPINFPAVFLQQLKDTTRKKNACLPFGMFLTLIFKEFGVNLVGEEFRNLVHSDFLNEGTLHRMRLVKRDGAWIRSEGVAAPLAAVQGTPLAAHESSRSSSESDSESVLRGATRAPGTPRTPVTDIRPPSPAAAPTPASGSVDHVPHGVNSPQVRRDRLFDEDQIGLITATLESKFESMFTDLKVTLLRRQEESNRWSKERFAVLETQLTEIIDRVSCLEKGNPSVPPSSSTPASSVGLKAFITDELEKHRMAAEGRHDEMLQQLRILSQRLETVERLQPPPPDFTDINAQLTFIIRLGNELKESQKKCLKIFTKFIAQLSSRIEAIISGASSSHTTHTPGPPPRPDFHTPAPPPRSTVPLDLRPLAAIPPSCATVHPGTGFTPHPAGPSSRTRKSQSRAGPSPTVTIASSDEE